MGKRKLPADRHHELFVKLNVKPATRLKLVRLAGEQNCYVYELIERLVDAEYRAWRRRGGGEEG